MLNLRGKSIFGARRSIGALVLTDGTLVVEISMSVGAPGFAEKAGPPRPLAMRCGPRFHTRPTADPIAGSVGHRVRRPRGAARMLDANAARQKADLVVLPETLTYYGSGRLAGRLRRADPGPVDRRTSPSWHRSTTCTSWPGLLERDGHLIYNVAVLIGPDGKVVGQVPQGHPAARRDRGRSRPGHGVPGFRDPLRQAWR